MRSRFTLSADHIAMLHALTAYRWLVWSLRIYLPLAVILTFWIRPGDIWLDRGVTFLPSLSIFVGMVIVLRRLSTVTGLRFFDNDLIQALLRCLYLDAFVPFLRR